MFNSGSILKYTEWFNTSTFISLLFVAEGPVLIENPEMLGTGVTYQGSMGIKG